MVGPGDEIAAGAGGHGHLRASRDDREHVVGRLKAAYVCGMVTKDEFDARVSQTFASRTYAELALVTADLPAGLAAAQPLPEPVRAKGHAPADANVRADRAIVATAIFAVLALAAALFTGNPVAGLLTLAAAGSASVTLLLARAQVRGSRRDKSSGGQLPPQRAIDRGRPPGRRAVTAAGQLPHASKSRRPGRADAVRSCLPRPQLSS